MTERIQTIIAWLSTLASSLYFGWMLFVLRRHAATVESMFEGLGTELPSSTRFVIENKGWLYLLLFGGAAVGLILKEFLVRDKKLSLALTLGVAILMLFVADWIRTVYFFPIFDIVEKLR